MQEVSETLSPTVEPTPVPYHPGSSNVAPPSLVVAPPSPADAVAESPRSPPPDDDAILPSNDGASAYLHWRRS